MDKEGRMAHWKGNGGWKDDVLSTNGKKGMDKPWKGWCTSRA